MLIQAVKASRAFECKFAVSCFLCKIKNNIRFKVDTPEKEVTQSRKNVVVSLVGEAFS